MTTILRIAGETFEADASGALWWPAQETLIAADLHFEKGSSYAVAGRLLPPYDTAETLSRLSAAIERYRPARVVCLGDSLHDEDAVARIAAADRETLAALMRDHDWIWIEGNHDPQPHGLGGRVLAEWATDRMIFRHEAQADGPTGDGEVSGHYHPCARMSWRGRSVGGRCFVEDGRRLVLPAFGAYTGGLDVGDPVIGALFPRGFRIHLIGRERLHRFDSRLLAAG